MGYPQDGNGFELAFTEPTSQIKVSQSPDFTSMIKNDAEGRESDYVMFTHFENPRPSVIYRLNVDLANDCSVQVKSIEPVDASEWGGAYHLHYSIVSAPDIPHLRVSKSIFIILTQAFGSPALDLLHHGILILDLRSMSPMQRISLPM